MVQYYSLACPFRFHFFFEWRWSKLGRHRWCDVASCLHGQDYAKPWSWSKITATCGNTACCENWCPKPISLSFFLRCDEREDKKTPWFVQFFNFFFQWCVSLQWFLHWFLNFFLDDYPQVHAADSSWGADALQRPRIGTWCACVSRNIYIYIYVIELHVYMHMRVCVCVCVWHEYVYTYKNIYHISIQVFSVCIYIQCVCVCVCVHIVFHLRVFLLCIYLSVQLQSAV